jgi:N-acetylmuramoyl-L-alanine amidase
MTTINVSIIQGANYQDNLNLEYDGQTITYNQQRLYIHINDILVKTGDMPAIILDSRTLVPVREIFESEAIGATVEWNAEFEEVYIKYEDQSVILQINSAVAQVNGKEVSLDVPAKLIRDTDKNISKTMIPLRFVAEQLGYTVKWDGENFIAQLYSEDYSGDDFQEEHDHGDLVSKGNLEENNADGWIEPVADSTVIQTSLFGNSIVQLANDKERELLIENKVVNDIESVETDSVGIYNMIFHYDDTIPEKVTFEVAADGPISGVITSLEGNNMELYILKATLDMNTTKFEYDDSPFIDALSIVEYTGGQTGNQNCLITFDLNSKGTVYNIRMNELRTKVFIDVVMDHVEDLVVGQNEIGDYIDIQGVGTDQVEVYRANASTLSFDINKTTTLMTKEIDNIDGEYINSLSVSQKDTTTTNITVDLKGAPHYEITIPKENVTRIQFMKSKQKNLSYSIGESSSFMLKDMNDIEEIFNSIEGIDEYSSREFQVIIPGNHLEQFGTEFIEINNAGIDDLQLSLTKEGDTRITIRTNKIQGVSMAKYGNQLVFETHNPKELYSHVIIIDPGHGGRKPGTGSKGYYEKNVNLQVALKLKTLLDNNQDIKAYYTRVDDSDSSLSERVELANEVDADFFLSLHSNSYGQLKTGAVSLYMDRETNRNISSYEFAKQIHNDYVANTMFIDKVITERDNLYVLKYTKMPAALLEMGYMSNGADLRMLLDDAHQVLMAEGIYTGIINAFKLLVE